MDFINLPVNEVSRLEVAHGRGNLRRDVHQDDLADLLAVGVPQVVQEISARHELRDDVEGWFAGADAQELDQVGVRHLLHDGGLLQEISQLHRVLLKKRQFKIETMQFKGKM